MSVFLRFAISFFLTACASASAAHNLMLYSVVSDNYVSKSEIREKIEKLRRDDRNADLMLVLINPHFLDADVLSVPLPSGITISYQRDNSSSWLARDPHTWLGGLTPGSISSILLSSTHGLSGHFIFEDVTYHLYPIDGDLAVVVKNVQAPPVKPDEGALEPPPAENVPSSPPVSPPPSTSARSDSIPITRVSVVQTHPALSEFAGPVVPQSMETTKCLTAALAKSGVGVNDFRRNF